MLDWYVYRPVRTQFARAYRPLLGKVVFLGITGSAGKTSTKSMVVAIFKTAGRVRYLGGSGNRIHDHARTVANTRTSDDFCVLEFGAESPNCFDPMVRLVRPTIAVVTTIGQDHRKAFGSMEAIAAEKGKLVEAIPPEGTAVLNADDPLVWDMRRRCRGKIVSFGQQDGLDVKASDLSAQWPDRLSFTVTYRDEVHRVQTQYCGAHWVTSVLAALAAAVAVRIPLAQAVEAVSQIPPPKARMEPAVTADGITFIRDDWKAPYWSMPLVFDFLRNARAKRKILAIGTLADYEGTARTKYRIVGEKALKVADIVFFVGKMATLGLHAHHLAKDGKILRAYPSIRQASDALQELLQPGDLVVLKGSGYGDHLGRLYYARTGPVDCWRMDCNKMTLCEGCILLRPAGEPGSLVQRISTPHVPARKTPLTSRSEAPDQVFVGIGNPGAAYRDTPHNMGFAVLDLLAQRHGLSWQDCGDAEIAELPHAGMKILLVKPQKMVNHTGNVLLELGELIGFPTTPCVLVHDDIHLPIGKVRTRFRGSDGGHKGVRSVLVAFQSSEFLRVKVGVAKAAHDQPAKDYLVSPFPADVSSTVAASCEEAAERLLRLSKELAGQRQVESTQ